MREPTIVSLLKRQREEAGLSQLALAERVGVSRQALIAIEAGRAVPSTSLSLQLARALGCGVDDLFKLAPVDGLDVRLAPEAAHERHGRNSPESARVAIGQVEGRWVAHPLPHGAPSAADGILQERRRGSTGIAQPLVEVAHLERNVLVAGCAPLLGNLAQRVGLRYRDARVTWLPANSERALELLAAGLVHVAGLHLRDERAGLDNLSAVRKRFPGRRMLVVNLTRWRQGLVVAPCNPLAIREVGDLLRPGLRFVRREEGAGASRLVQRLLSDTGAKPPDGPLVSGHEHVAQLVRYGAADVGVAIESVAVAADLGFVPLAEERFDLVMPAESAELAPVSRLIDALSDLAFRSEAERLPGYDGSVCGQAITLDAA